MTVCQELSGPCLPAAISRRWQRHRGSSQTRPAVTARQLLAYVWVEVLGRRASDLARALGQTRGNISTAARRGAAQAARWQAEISQWCRCGE